jgi:uncharacterized protein YciI
MYFAVWATDRKGTGAKRVAVREAHRARLRDPGEHPVKVVAGGPTLDDSTGAMDGSLLIIEAEDIETVRSFVQGDPYVTHQVYDNVEIRAWQWGLGCPEEP